MMLAPKVSRYSPLRPAPRPKPRLLLVSDTPEGLRQLRRSINLKDFEITCAGALNELPAACREAHDMVILDVQPAQLVRTLKQLRASTKHQDALLLVNAACLNGDTQLTGVLPAYRAMPCSPLEMATLMRHFNETETDAPHPRGVL